MANENTGPRRPRALTAQQERLADAGLHIKQQLLAGGLPEGRAHAGMLAVWGDLCAYGAAHPSASKADLRAALDAAIGRALTTA